MQRDASTLSPEDVIHDLGANAKRASKDLLDCSTETINKALVDAADLLRKKQKSIIEKNALDISKAQSKNLTKAQIDRLMLNPERIEAMAKSLEEISKMPDPVGKVLTSTKRPNGLQIDKVSTPFGVLGMIYESRPNVTIDAAALALKSHNAIILRGGSESLNSSLALHKILCDALEDNGLARAAVGIVETCDRSVVSHMLHSDQYIDVMIPRGGAGLIERVMKEARMPVFAHLDGICHIYIHQDADPTIAKEVTLNAKLRRTGICGAAETLLIDAAYPEKDREELVKSIIREGCKVAGDEVIQTISSSVSRAREIDWATEYLDSKISAKIVDDEQAAIDHINHYGSHHTDSIITKDEAAAEQFMKYVDSGIVMHNASTQFADGGEFGMGAEIGISTGKMHARGPVGLEQLVTYKYKVRGSGQTRP